MDDFKNFSVFVGSSNPYARRKLAKYRELGLLDHKNELTPYGMRVYEMKRHDYDHSVFKGMSTQGGVNVNGVP